MSINDRIADYLNDDKTHLLTVLGGVLADDITTGIAVKLHGIEAELTDKYAQAMSEYGILEGLARVELTDTTPAVLALMGLNAFEKKLGARWGNPLMTGLIGLPAIYAAIHNIYNLF